MVTLAGSQVVARADLAAHLTALRARAPHLVLTNGVFDLLHLGHLRYLQTARTYGDALIVGINSDHSTRQLKGPTRPLVPEAERAELIAGLACVDLVTIFDELTAETLVELVRPAVYVKGGDYALSPSGTTSAMQNARPLPEAASVIALGGQVELVPYLSGHSTTELMARIVSGNR